MTCYVGIHIYTDKNMNSMYRSVNTNVMNILEFLLNGKPRLGNSSNMKFTQVPIYIQSKTHAS